MAKKELRRAARQTQQTQQKGRRPGAARPTLRRAATQGAILTALYVVVMYLFFRSTLPVWWAEILYVGIFFVMYTGFVYFWENYLYNRRQRRQQGGKK